MAALLSRLDALTPGVLSFLADVGDCWRSWLPPDEN
jgi:hypothetical protein